MRGTGDVLRPIRAITAVVLLVAAAVIAAGCTAQNPVEGEASAGTPQHGGRVVIGLSKEPPIVNPWLAQGAMVITSMLVDGLNDPLVTLDEHGRWQPVLATTVPTVQNGMVQEAAGGGMTVRVELQPNAHWSDGHPITCADVAFTWKTIMKPENQISNRLGWDQIVSIDCPQPKLAIITFMKPYALYLSRVLALGPLPRHELEGKDFNSYWNERITVSSGPFVFGEWQRGVKLVLRRNDDYWGAENHDLPYVDEVVFRFVKDANTLKMQLRMEEADIAVIPADTNLSAELEALDGVEYDVSPGAVMEHLVLQTGRPPLDDVRVRQALAHLVDRELIARVVLKDQVPPLHSGIVPTQPQFAYDGFARYRYDPERAGRLLVSAGFEQVDGWWTRNGNRLKLTFVAGAGSMPFRARVAQLLQEQLREQGVDLEIQLVAPEVLYTDLAPQGEFDIGEWSEPANADPAPALLWACNQIPQKPQWAGKNRYRYCNPELDELMYRADTTLDDAERVRLLRQVDAITARDVPFLPLFQSPDTIAWNGRVQGLRPNVISTLTWNMHEWWVVQP